MDERIALKGAPGSPYTRKMLAVLRYRQIPYRLLIDEVAPAVSAWERQPYPYQAKCLQWLRQEFARLDEGDRGFVRDLLTGTGCEPLFVN
jgi:hypothetical protein